MYNVTKITSYLGIILLGFLFSACNSRQKEISQAAAEPSVNENKYIMLVRNDEEKKVDVFIGGELFTSYIYPKSIDKPVLYPIKTAQGTIITRGFPLVPRQGERIDHPHHVGLWFNYGDVNGLDFWNNSDAVPAEEKAHYGTIFHKEINSISNGDDKGVLEVTMEWVGPDDKAMLEENTTFAFSGSESRRTIDRITTLKALGEDVSMKDNKEGLICLRVARDLEHPSDRPEEFTDGNGEPTGVPVLNNEGVTGMYRSSEGIEGEAAWGTRAKWMNLSGQIKGENISVVILDHPDNVGYPTYWHVRGYGLYAANNLGQKALSGGKEELNFMLPAGESVTFKHRIVIYSGDKVGDEQIDKDFEEFAL